MRRLFVQRLADHQGDDEVPLDAAAVKHAKVLRLALGSRVVLFDGLGHVAEATLHAGYAALENWATIEAEPPHLGLIQGLPKLAKADEIVRFATELGARDVLFVPTERSASNGRKNDGRSELAKRMGRWQRIAQESGRQSERLHLPRISIAESLDEALARPAPNSDRRLCWARVSQQAPAPLPTATERWVLVGPEGGLTDDELERARTAHFSSLSLGRHILRVDTAAAAALTLLGREDSPND